MDSALSFTDLVRKEESNFPMWMAYFLEKYRKKYRKKEK